MVVSSGDYHGGNRLRGRVFAYQYIGYRGMMVAALGVLHVFFNTYYRITEDDMLIAHCSIFPEKKIAIADIEVLESTVMPVSSYALSLDRLIIWSNGKPWMLISPTNRADFIKQLRKINPNIQLK